MTIEELIKDVERLESEGSLEDALDSVENVLIAFPQDYRGWLLRSSLYEQKKEYSKAISDLDKAIRSAPTKLYLFYSRGRYRYELNDYEAAAKDFGEALRLGLSRKDNYYRQELLFWRAETLLQLGKKSDALRDVLQVDDGFRTYTFALRTKDDLLADCKR